MNIDYIIIQAGGKGTRLEELAQNKPKALCPVNNRPIVFHLFELFPTAKYVIIGDHQYDVLKNYLEIFAKVPLVCIHAEGNGNICGIREAIRHIPDGKAFLLLWSDLLLDSDIDFKSLREGNYAGITNRFRCSWRLKNNFFEKIPTTTDGVAGCFIFREKSALKDIPCSGSFTGWLQKIQMNMLPLNMLDSHEVGSKASLLAVDRSKQNRCRPYNRMIFNEERVIKEGLTKEGKELIKREALWYKAVISHGFMAIPRIYSFNPLTMGQIHGENIFKASLTDVQKKNVLDKLVECLNQLHSMGQSFPSSFDMQEDYYNKTFRRLAIIRAAIPFSSHSSIKINGKVCKNPLLFPYEFQNMVNKIISGQTQFGIIHGDCTLTNTMIDNEQHVYFIDARGYFGHTEFIGDVYYDWAKLYYSVQGCFDQFNIKNFSLLITNADVSYKIASSGWENLTGYLLAKIKNCDEFRIKMIHAIIWLSLASHCWEDYDSMCLAFYNGVYLWNELL